MDKHSEVCHVEKESLDNPTYPEWDKRMNIGQRRIKELTDHESYLMGEAEKVKIRLEEVRREAAVLMAGQEAGNMALKGYADYLMALSAKGEEDPDLSENGQIDKKLTPLPLKDKPPRA